MVYASRKNVEQYREYARLQQRRRRAKLREYLLEVKSAGCLKCGELHPACLQFHHVDPSTKVNTINRLLSQTKSLAKVSEEISKCLLLCANCHAKEHWDSTHEEVLDHSSTPVDCGEENHAPT